MIAWSVIFDVHVCHHKNFSALLSAVAFVILRGYECLWSRSGKKVQRFKSLFICCTFEVKFLPLKLCRHTHFNVCACVVLQSKIVLLIMWACSRKVEPVLLAAFEPSFVFADETSKVVFQPSLQSYWEEKKKLLAIHSALSVCLSTLSKLICCSWTFLSIISSWLYPRQ